VTFYYFEGPRYGLNAPPGVFAIWLILFDALYTLRAFGASAVIKELKPTTAYFADGEIWVLGVSFALALYSITCLEKLH
jgi:hypothetical protein